MSELTVLEELTDVEILTVANEPPSVTGTVSGTRPLLRAPKNADVFRHPRADKTDVGNVTLLAQLTNGDMKYVSAWACWIVWDGLRWHKDNGGTAVHQRCLQVSRHYMDESIDFLHKSKEINTPDHLLHEMKKRSDEALNWANQCRNQPKLDALRALAERSTEFHLDAGLVDADPLLIGVLNGVVDLRTGLLHPASKDQYVLKTAKVKFNVNATAPRWEKFVEEITSSTEKSDVETLVSRTRPELANYLQKALGYSITGKTNEQVMFIATGSGSNGKSVLLDTFQRIGGNYCKPMQAEVLMTAKMDRNPEQASPSIKSLAGARCAISSESKVGQRLDTALIKAHTGGGTITARALHENLVEFEMTHKLWLMTNTVPDVEHMDDALKGRLHIIPFDMRWNRPGATYVDPALPTADKSLMDTLKDESEGIFLWLVRGAMLYLNDGLSPPNEVTAMTKSYIEEQDILRRWLGTLVKCQVTDGLLACELFAAYKKFCEAEGEPIALRTASALGKELGRRGVQKAKMRDGARYAIRAQLLCETKAAVDVD
jgi:putative DNA primase/helicase